jgi:hypothetical protein
MEEARKQDAEKDRKESEAREEARKQEVEAFKKESEARDEPFKKDPRYPKLRQITLW